VAVGLADGTVLLLRHIDQIVASTTANSAPSSLPKIKVLHQPSNEPITGLAFVLISTATDSGSLFVVTTNKILTFPASGKSSTPNVQDDAGAAVGCSLATPEGKLLLAREEAIYVYSQEGREATFACEGPKSALHLFGNYLIIVSPPFVPSAASNSATVRNFVAKNQSSNGTSDIARIGLFETVHKYIGQLNTVPNFLKVTL